MYPSMRQEVRAEHRYRPHFCSETDELQGKVGRQRVVGLNPPVPCARAGLAIVAIFCITLLDADGGKLYHTP